MSVSAEPSSAPRTMEKFFSFHQTRFKIKSHLRKIKRFIRPRARAYDSEGNHQSELNNHGPPDAAWRPPPETAPAGRRRRGPQ
jgi:hypothetical protein